MCSHALVFSSGKSLQHQTQCTLLIDVMLMKNTSCFRTSTLHPSSQVTLQVLCNVSLLHADDLHTQQLGNGAHSSTNPSVQEAGALLSKETLLLPW